MPSLRARYEDAIRSIESRFQADQHRGWWKSLMPVTATVSVVAVFQSALELARTVVGEDEPARLLGCSRKQCSAIGIYEVMDRALVVSRIRRVVSFGWPRDFPLVQFPNVALVAAFASGQAAAMLHGIGRGAAAGASYAAMLVWAYEELVDGVNWFRHLLGLVYVISTIAHIALALGR